jgi:hypothetical protein
MAPNFIGCGREQAFLMPPSLCDWGPEDHLVWTVLGAVEALDLAGFYAVYRARPHWRHVTRGHIFRANPHRHEWVEGIGWCVRVRVDPERPDRKPER